MKSFNNCSDKISCVLNFVALYYQEFIIIEVDLYYYELLILFYVVATTTYTKRCQFHTMNSNLLFERLNIY